MYKTIYNKYEALNYDGCKISDEIYDAIEPIVLRLSKENYSMIEIQSLMVSIANNITAFTKIKRAMNKRKEERNGDK